MHFKEAVGASFYGQPIKNREDFMFADVDRNALTHFNKFEKK